jgi:hypothetical protein
MADPLLKELSALRAEIAGLREVVGALVIAIERSGSPAIQADAMEPWPPNASGSSPAQQLARRNAERLNHEVLRRTAQGLDPAADTEVDLLIDRLHDLVDPTDPSGHGRPSAER